LSWPEYIGLGQRGSPIGAATTPFTIGPRGAHDASPIVGVGSAVARSGQKKEPHGGGSMDFLLFLSAFSSQRRLLLSHPF
jgi:hypothetical protein